MILRCSAICQYFLCGSFVLVYLLSLEVVTNNVRVQQSLYVLCSEWKWCPMSSHGYFCLAVLNMLWMCLTLGLLSYYFHFKHFIRYNSNLLMMSGAVEWVRLSHRLPDFPLSLRWFLSVSPLNNVSEWNFCTVTVGIKILIENQ